MQGIVVGYNTDEDRKPDLQEAGRELREAIDHANHLVSVLGDRLSPVLGPDYPHQGDGDVAKENESSPVVIEMRHLRNAVRITADMVESILRRLTL